MRTIKFRGLRTDGKGWVYGNLIINKDGSCWIKNTDYNVNNGRIDLIPYKVTPESVGQFTGLLDKNGKEIYEGDVLELGSGRYIVRWDLVSWNPKALIKDKVAMPNNFFPDWFYYNEYSEIIGNIHQNPELL